MSRSKTIDGIRGGPRVLRSGRLLVAAAVGCLVAAGSLLWWHEGGAVFASVVSGALAWCM